MIHGELADDYGIRVGRKPVARLMRAAGLRGPTMRRNVITTLSDPHSDRPVDLVDRRFYTVGPHRLWVADITYVPTWAGFLYLAMVLDLDSREIDGWAMETHLRTELIVAGSTWRSNNVARPTSSITPAEDASTRAMRSASAVVRPASSLR